MKIYISADIDGITGVTHWDETSLDKAECQAAREQMTAEVAAACRGALEAGATEIVVKDSHDQARNLIAAGLPREARLVRGWSGHPFVMLEGLDKTYHAVFLVGYHSRIGLGASPLAHTMTGMFTQVLLNDQPASEFLLCAGISTLVGVPIAFLSGDQGICDEVQQFNPAIHSLAVKEGLGDSTNNLHPAVSVERIQQAALKALQRDLAGCISPLPKLCSLQIRFRRHPLAYHASFYPGAQKVDDYTVRYENKDYFEILRFLSFVEPL